LKPFKAVSVINTFPMNRKDTRVRQFVRRPNRNRRKANADGGKRFIVSPHPPSFISCPWFNLVVRIANPSVIINTVTLRDALISQLGLSPNITYAVRLQQVRFWGALVGATSGTPPPPINVIINDPIGLSTTTSGSGVGIRVLEQFTDYPDVVQRACFGYRYPRAQREFSLGLTGTISGNLFVTNGMGAGSVVYVTLQWRTSLLTPPALTGEDSDDLVSSFYAVNL
jgi:hypothetical protein